MTSEFVPSVQDDGLFGRWEDMQAWGKEADAIIEKPLPASLAESIPFPGLWSVTVSIPGRRDHCYYGDAMEAGLALLAEVGIHAEEAYLEGGYCFIELKPRKSLEAAFLAEQVRKSLVANGYRVNLGHETGWSQDVPAGLRLVKNDGYVPTTGDWSLTVIIPEELGGIRTGRKLAAHLGMTPLEHDRLAGDPYFFKFKIDDFGDAKAKTKQAISWLEERDFEIETSWGDAGLCLDPLSEETLRSLHGIDHHPGDPVRVTRPFVSLVDEKNNKAPEWLSRLMRIAARADGSAEQLPIVFRSREARILLDLALESCFDYAEVLSEWEDFHHGYHVSKLCRYHTKDLEKAKAILQEIVGKLQAALDGTKRALPRRNNPTKQSE